jgi:acyl-CoA dehydrogenase
MAEAALVFEELGRALCSAPLLGTMALAGRTLHHAGEAGHEQLAAIASGQLRATGALHSAGAVRVLESSGPTLSG